METSKENRRHVSCNFKYLDSQDRIDESDDRIVEKVWILKPQIGEMHKRYSGCYIKKRFGSNQLRFMTTNKLVEVVDSETLEPCPDVYKDSKSI